MNTPSESRFVLLGAGASVGANIKDAFAMTREFLRLFSEDPDCRRQSHALRYVVGGLMMQKGARGEDPLGGINIEDVFNAMQTLASRQLFEAAPFVAGWHPIVEELDTLESRFSVKHSVSVNTQYSNSSYANKIDTAISRFVAETGSRPQAGKEVRAMVENSLRHLKSEVSGGGDRPGDGRVFRVTCDKMTQKLVQLVWLKQEDQSRVEYLRPLVRAAFRNNVTIATLNYDTTIEVAARAEGYFVHTYMGEAASSEKEAKNILDLLKLHGSIDWRAGNAYYRNDVLPQTRVVRAGEDEMTQNGYKPSVIFGQRNKMTAEEPFLKLFSEFRSQMERATELIVIGYSFRDQHINESIARWLNAQPDRVVTVVTPNDQWAAQSDFARKLGELEKGGKRVRHIPKKAEDAIPELF